MSRRLLASALHHQRSELNPQRAPKVLECCPPDLARRVLQVVQAVAEELHSGITQELPQGITLDTSLQTELGMDSLGRSELLARIENALGIVLSGEKVFFVETVRDLLREVETASARTRRIRPAESGIAAPEAGMENRGVPTHARTLNEVLDWQVEANPQRIFVRFYDANDELSELSLRDFRSQASGLAYGLRQRGLMAGDRVALMLPSGFDFLESFFGILLAGGIPVPIYPPYRASLIEDHVRRQIGILSNCRASFLLATAEASRLRPLLRSSVPGLRDLLIPAELREMVAPQGVSQERPMLSEKNSAFIQYTSGSTGDPKGTILTHRNVLANIRAMGSVLKAGPSDVMVSWLPLYHDMGLIGAFLGSLYFGASLILMSPFSFIARPSRWLQAIHRHKGTLSAAPNFAYELCLRRVTDHDLQGLDLSSWRAALNGAEPVSENTLRHFSDKFRPCGFQPSAFMPVYGLAESSVGLAFPPLGRGPRIDFVQRQALFREGRAIRSTPGDPKTAACVGSGFPLPGHEIRIVNARGREMGEREVGILEFRGPSATSGYFRNAEATRALFRGDWLDSQDFAYLSQGEVFITGRVKDTIIRAGRNIYPYEIEERIGDLKGTRKGGIAVFGSPDPESGTERLIVAVETEVAKAEPDDLRRLSLQQEVLKVASELLEGPPDHILLVPPRSIPKTSSGKIRRSTCRELYERHEFGRHRPVALQLLRLTGSAVSPGFASTMRSVMNFGYGLYFWAIVGILALPAWIVIFARSELATRLASIRFFIRLISRLAGIPLQVSGVENLPMDRSFIIVANHSSYLDILYLTAAVPGTYWTVGKRELSRNWLLAPLLRRLGCLFVERFDPKGALEAAHEVRQAALNGKSLVVFPEGTFSRSSGLRKFRMGAFVAAQESGVPVIPVTLRGTRETLPENRWIPRRGRVKVIVSKPIYPSRGAGWPEALRISAEARAEILRHCGEPDAG